MFDTIKSPVFYTTLFLLLFLVPSEVKAQSCDDTFYQARDYYYKGKFDSIPGLLVSCLNSFKKNEKYYQERNPEMVFRVYKLITASYYQMDLDYKAEEREDDLIRYFKGIYKSNTVLERLSNTKF